jgi:hypothetical protein
MKTELVTWLEDIGEAKSADFLNNCRVDLVYVDTVFEMIGNKEWELMNAQIKVPGRYFIKLQSDFLEEVKTIENQFTEVANAIGMHVRKVNWVPKIDEETEMKVKI